MTEVVKTVTYDTATLSNPQVCQGSPRTTSSPNHEGHPVTYGSVTCPLCGYQPYLNDISTAAAFIAAPHPARHPASEIVRLAKLADRNATAVKL